MQPFPCCHFSVCVVDCAGNCVMGMLRNTQWGQDHGGGLRSFVWFPVSELMPPSLVLSLSCVIWPRPAHS